MMLLPHQSDVINRVVERCRHQHGLLIFHQMGTGKTLTSLALLTHFPHDAKAVFFPGHLSYVWYTETKKHNMNENIALKTHKDLLSYNIQDKIVVIDEAHNITHMIRQMEPSQAHIFVNKLQTCKHIFLLSGTPLYKDITDLAMLVNIAAGKNVITYNGTTFSKRYLDLTPKTSAIYGYFLPYLNQYGTVGLSLAFFSTTNRMKQYMLTIVQNFMTDHKIPWHLFPKMSEMSASSILKNENTPQILIYGLLLILMSITMRMNQYSLSAISRFGTRIDPIRQDFTPYIDFFSADQLATFPKNKEIIKYVNYNIQQAREWMKAAINISDKDSSFLNEKSEEDPENMLFKVSTDNYLDVGRIIGNTTFLENQKTIYPPKFIQILEFIKQNPGNHIIYSNFYKKGIVLLGDFFRQNRITYRVLMPRTTIKQKGKIIDDFKNGKFNILLLHPTLYEGISVPGAQFMHILEPIMEFYKHEQVLGRVLRIDSHVHLPSEERHVTIIHWISAEQNYFRLFIRQLMLKMSLWSQYFSKVSMLKVLSDDNLYGITRTPEQIIFNLRSHLFTFKKALHEALLTSDKPCGKKNL